MELHENKNAFLTKVRLYITKVDYTKVTDFSWSFISLLVSSLVYLLLRIIIGKELGVSLLGTYTLVYTIYMFGLQFSDFGIGASLTKYIAEYNNEKIEVDNLISSGIIGALISGSLLCFFLYILSDLLAINVFHNPNMSYLLKLTAVCYPFMATEKAVIGALNGLRKMNQFAYLYIIQNMSVFMISLLLVNFLKMGIIGAVLGFVLPTITVGIISISFIRHSFILTKERFLSYLKKILCFGSYIILTDSLGLLNTQIDSLFIGHFMNELNVGYYAVASIFVQGIILIPRSIQRITAPLIANYFGKKEFKNIRKLVKTIVIESFLLTLLVSLSLIIFGKFFIKVLFTSDFLPAYTPMLILLIGYSIYAPWASIGTFFSSIGDVKVTLKIAVLCSFLNILLNSLLIPSFGLNGAAVATSLSLILTTIVSFYLTKKYMKYFGLERA